MSHPADTIGDQIRKRRLDRGLTLEDLAKASSVSVTMLSEVERARKNPTVKLAWQIARALECSLTELLDDPPVQPISVVRATDRKSLVDEESGVARHGVNTALRRRGLEVVTYELSPKATTGPLPANRPGVLEHIMVTKGKLKLTVAKECLELKAGDHATYHPQATVTYSNASSSRTSFVLLSDSGKGNQS